MLNKSASAPEASGTAAATAVTATATTGTATATTGTATATTGTATAATGTAAADFDLNSADLAENPYPAYAELRSQCPVAHSDQVGWVVSGYQEVYEATCDHQVFRSDWGAKAPIPANIPRTAEPEQSDFMTYTEFSILPIEVDPPIHGPYRKLLQSMFASRTVQETWTGDARRIADELIDALDGRGEVDFVHAFSMPMSGRMLATAAGIDEAERDLFQELTMDLHGNIDAVNDFLRRSIDTAERGAFAVLRHASIDGRPLTEQEKLGYGIILVHAGWETTASAISSMVFRLATEPELRARLLADEALIPRAVEEFLRIDSPVQGLWRTAGQDTDLAGAEIHRGDKVLLMWGAANRDPEKFADPDQVEFGRDPNPHLAFGVGVHRCLGAHLARLTLNVSLERILHRLPAFRVKPGEGPERVNGAVWATHHLPIEFLPS
jgi:cytochrome P450